MLGETFPRPLPDIALARGGTDSRCRTRRARRGAINPDATQTTLTRTVCKSGRTKTIRPPASYEVLRLAGDLAGRAYWSLVALEAY
jgi:hypothetical protein